MDRGLVKILSQYSENERLLDQFLVSLFIKSNKLQARNNKLILSYLPADEEKHFDSINFLKIHFGFDELIEAFESIIPEKDKVVNGAVYTPGYIKEYIISEGLKTQKTKLDKIKVSDISCGCGGFLVTVAQKLRRATGKSYKEIFEENIFGLDISSYSINRAKILLSLLSLVEGEDVSYFHFNLFVGNALGFDWKNECSSIKENDGFDLIVGNPPYVRSKNIDERDKKLLSKWFVTKSGNTDLYIPFFEVGLKNLTKNGTLGYITVNSFFKSVNARLLRKYLHLKSFDISIIDFGNEKIFGSKSAYTCICLINNNKSDSIKFVKSESNSIGLFNYLDFNKIPYNSLNSQKGWLLNNTNAIINIKKIENIGTPLGRLFKIKNGIATLSNETYIFKPISESRQYFIRKVNNIEYKIEKAICRDIIKPNILKDESEISKLKEKLIYPYTNGISAFTLLNENDFKTKFPYAYKYLEVNKSTLLKRDKGSGDYGAWYAFGRTQALTDKGYKLLFPYMAKQPYFIFTNQKDLLIYCGYAIFSNSEVELLILKKILESTVFDYYIKNSSKPYSGGYFSYAKNYVKNFGICYLSPDEKDYLKKETDKNMINSFLIDKYELHIPKHSHTLSGRTNQRKTLSQSKSMAVTMLFEKGI